MRKLSAWLVVALTGGAFVAGCGSSSNSTTSSQTTPTSAPLSPAAAAKAVASCKQAIQTQSTLSAAAKTRLEGICEKAPSSNQTAVRKAECVELVNASVPAGAARERALAVCKAP